MIKAPKAIKYYRVTFTTSYNCKIRDFQEIKHSCQLKKCYHGTGFYYILIKKHFIQTLWWKTSICYSCLLFAGAQKFLTQNHKVSHYHLLSEEYFVASYLDEVFDLNGGNIKLHIAALLSYESKIEKHFMLHYSS